MGKSGRAMDAHTKGFQKAEGKNSTIKYNETGTGVSATVTSGGSMFTSQSHSTKDAARSEAADMANDSLGFLYED